MFRQTRDEPGKSSGKRLTKSRNGNKEHHDEEGLKNRDGNKEHQHEQYDPDEAFIYATPTVDTLGDESSALSRFYLSPQRDHGKTTNSTLYLSNENNIYNSSNPIFANHNGEINPYGRRHLKPVSSKADNNNSSHKLTSKKQPRDEKQRLIFKQYQLQQKQRQQQRTKSCHNREFQLEEDAMSVMIRDVCVAERTAFDKKLPPYVVNLDCDENNDSNRKISPSLKHWRVLQQLSNITHVRQLAFSNSVGSAADLFWSEEEEDDANWEGSYNTTTTNNNKDKPSFPRRDGRYRSINPVKATTAALPKTPPLLSNKKYRLPMRADVGFPHASVEEVSQKQEEIRCETKWEEASPRLVVLVTGDDLGTAVEEHYHEIGEAKIDVNPLLSRSDRYKNRGLPGMPWAGKDLINAKECNNRHFSRRQESSILSSLSHHDAIEERATNMLAPPLDAICKRTLDWRARPFHDRPSGVRYTLVCPLEVEFSVGKMEPLVCTLALYSLTNGKLSEEFYFPSGDWEGKLQLDSLQGQPSAHRKEKLKTNGDMRREEMDALQRLWSQRKHKAIFAHSSLLCKNKKEEDIYVVLQVFKVTHKDSFLAYWAKRDSNNKNSYDILSSSSSSSLDRKTWKKKVKEKLFHKDPKKREKLSRSYSDTDNIADELDVERTVLRSNATFEAYGTQFMSPLCFGITNLFPEDIPSTNRKNAWPRGQVQQGINLYSSPTYSESQESFVQRLRKVVSPKTQPINDIDNLSKNSSTDLSMLPTILTRGETVKGGEDHSVGSFSQIHDSSSTEFMSPSKKKGSVRRFMNPRRMSKRDLEEPLKPKLNLSSTSIQDTPLMPGSATLFTSNLNIDFLQSMLTTPPELKDMMSLKASIGSETTSNVDKGIHDQAGELILPRILVDASGDSAIMIDPTKASTGSSSENSAKRSDLVRLPSTGLAECLDSSEFREVLSFSTEVDYDHKSSLNLLYLYPLLLIQKSKDDSSSHGGSSKQGDRHQRYTIRIRLIQSLSSPNETGVIESWNEITTSFYNPACWGGPNLLKSVFTRIPAECSSSSFATKEQSIGDSRAGIPFRDEFKIKLPTILDGSYCLQFSLFSVELNDHIDEPSSSANVGFGGSVSGGEEDCGITLNHIAETSIPLSSSSTRDPKYGVKATTIIPNGCHRLRLGQFQLQVETRLVSSIHVSDPVVAAILRGFPVASIDGQIGVTENNKNSEEMVIITARSTSSCGGNDIPKETVPYSTLLSIASDSALACHFQSLFFLHLRNLTKKSYQDTEATENFIVENMASLLKLLQKVKSSKARVDVFIKATVDSFDEESHNNSGRGEGNEDDSASDFFKEAKHKSASIELDTVQEGHDENFDGGAIRRRKRQPVSSDIDVRLSRTYSAMESSEVPFSRVAYGASKTDHMKLEAEMDGDQGPVSTLFDDDETVVTLTRIKHADAQLMEAKNKFEKIKITPSSDGILFSEAKSSSCNSLKHAEDESKNSNEIGFAAYQQTISELSLGKRMKSAAQVMLAPCVTVTPGLAAFLSCRTNPRHASEAFDYSNEKCDSTKRSQSDIDPVVKDIAHQILFPGSDIDDDDDDSASYNESKERAAYCSNSSIFRGSRNCRKLEFSIRRHHINRKKSQKVTRGLYTYESIMILWLKSWEDYVNTIHQSSSKNGIVINFLGNKSNNCGDKYAMFYLQIDILLPIMLKSICLRCAPVSNSSSKHNVVRYILDKDHAFMFDSFVEMLAIGLMGQAMAELQQNTEHGTLDKAIVACDHVVDFFIGLFAVFHPAHMEGLICKFFTTLRACETVQNGPCKDGPFEWNETTLHRTKCSRQLRLRAIEKLAVLPNFVALNFPLRFLDKIVSVPSKKSSWTMQYGIHTLSDKSRDRFEDESTTDGMLPRSGWLASLLTNESLSMVALACEAVVVEAIAKNIETRDSTNQKHLLKTSLKTRPTAFLKRSDLLMFQSIAIHGISCVYELLLRRHAMDRRFQNDSCRGRIASLFIKPIFEKSLASVRWLARMESTHKVRSMWLLCFIYILQEAPESLIREFIRSYSNPSDLKIHRFIRLLRLGSSTFQSFVDQERHCMFPLEIDKNISPWLLQESFNTLCATTIIVVEECVHFTSSIPNEQRQMIQGILDLFLHVMTTPQSTVTHLRAVGGAIQALEKFGIQMFLETTNDHFQHWIRIIIGLMNNVALSVRSISVDFVLSLLCGVFELHGNIEDVTMIFATVLPEVVAREIALHSVSGLITTFDDAEKSIWPLRRSFADIEDSDPLDDDRVDPQLSPILSVFCRASQAIIDGVLIEMRLRGDDCIVVGTRIPPQIRDSYIFDSDEESLFEAANFFAPESAPMQRLRWLLTLKSLHEAKEQWVEAGESLIMCARTISEAIPHLSYVWRPSRFSLWLDGRRSLWLSTVGEEIGHPEKGNTQVMTFANSFLEPEWMVIPNDGSNNLKLPQLNLENMCSFLTYISKEAISLYDREGGMDNLAYTRLESLLKIVMIVFDDHEIISDNKGERSNNILHRRQYVSEVACLRKVMASITGNMTKVADRILLNDEITINDEGPSYYVRLLLSGRKPRRFEESTSLPTFLEWNNPCICRVPKNIVNQASRNEEISERAVCNVFAKTLQTALLHDLDATTILFGSGVTEPENTNPDITYIDVGLVHADTSFGLRKGINNYFGNEYKRFRYYNANNSQVNDAVTSYDEMTVAITFPCPLSRQRIMKIFKVEKMSKSCANTYEDAVI